MPHIYQLHPQFLVLAVSLQFISLAVELSHLAKNLTEDGWITQLKAQKGNCLVNVVSI